MIGRMNRAGQDNDRHLHKHLGHSGIRKSISQFRARVPPIYSSLCNRTSLVPRLSAHTSGKPGDEATMNRTVVYDYVPILRHRPKNVSISECRGCVPNLCAVYDSTYVQLGTMGIITPPQKK